MICVRACVHAIKRKRRKVREIRHAKKTHRTDKERNVL